MTKNKRFELREVNCTGIVPKVYDKEKQQYANLFECVHWLNDLYKENEQLKEDLKRCKNFLNSDKYDYELTLVFIKNKGYSLKDVLEYEKELKSE